MDRWRWCWCATLLVGACGARSELGQAWLPDAASESGGRDARAESDAPDAGLAVSPMIAMSGAPGTPARACVLDELGNVKCWGRAPIGDGSEEDALTPRMVLLSAPASQLSVMSEAVCVLLIDQSVRCYGENSLELGQGAADDSLLDTYGNLPGATTVPGISGAAISRGGNFAVVARGDGTLVSWGRSNANSGLPETMVLEGRAIAATSGLTFSCALLDNGRVQCWGTNGNGELGDGTQATSFTPTSVAGLTDAVAIAAGEYHACALRSTGEVVCWGDAHGGQLGTTLDASTFSDLPLQVPLANPAIKVRAGGSEACAMDASGAATCWGHGYLGDGTGVRSFSPTPLPVGKLADVALAHQRTCVLLDGGGVQCWGDGPLGDGSPVGAASNSPVAVSGLP
jgi:hypothetical protein